MGPSRCRSRSRSVPPGRRVHLRAARRPLRPPPAADDRPGLLLASSKCSTGFAPNFTTFLVLRALFGIGMGGEWGVGASLAMEKVPPRLRGLLSGLLQEGYAAGNLLAAICYFSSFRAGAGGRCSSSAGCRRCSRCSCAST